MVQGLMVEMQALKLAKEAVDVAKAKWIGKIITFLPSMFFYPDFIPILSRFYPDFIPILSRFYSDFIPILSNSYL